MTSPLQSRKNTPWPEWVEHAVLVYGPRKAGTTLLHNLLDGGDEILVYPAELKLKSFARQSRKRNHLANYCAKSRIPQVKSIYFSCERYLDLWSKAGPFPNDLAKLVRYDAWFVHQCSSGKSPDCPRMWCAKEVGGNTKRIVTLWRELFPRARIIFIIRDPLMVTRAVLNDRRRKGVRLGVWDIIHQTLDPLRVLKAQAELICSPDIYAVAYEDLVENTAGTIRLVAAHLGVKDEPALHRPSIFGEAVVVRTSSKVAKHVFGGVSDWREGLTRREKLFVSLATAATALLPRYRINYASLRSSISNAMTVRLGSKQLTSAPFVISHKI
jgi:sulfotransferase family protein